MIWFFSFKDNSKVFVCVYVCVWTCTFYCSVLVLETISLPCIMFQFFPFPSSMSFAYVTAAPCGWSDSKLLQYVF